MWQCSLQIPYGIQRWTRIGLNHTKKKKRKEEEEKPLIIISEELKYHTYLARL